MSYVSNIYSYCPLIHLEVRGETGLDTDLRVMSSFPLSILAPVSPPISGSPSLSLSLSPSLSLSSIYIYISLSLSLALSLFYISLSLSLSLSLVLSLSLSLSIYIYIYIYIYQIINHHSRLVSLYILPLVVIIIASLRFQTKIIRFLR